MKINNEFIKRRWLDFRYGHSTYLIFAMAFFQFVIITYTLAIERFPALEGLFPSMAVWAAVFVVIYLPSAIIVGHFHLRNQIPTEARQMHNNNPFAFRIAPGRDALLNIPAVVIGYEKQLKSMRIHNQLADAFREQFGMIIEKWSAEDFADIERLLQHHKRLQLGESIADIVKEQA